MANNSNNKLKTISVFGSHDPKPGTQDYSVAYELGRLLAMAGYTVATGGYEGTMAAVSQGSAEVGGHVIGVTSKQVEMTRSTILNAWVKEEVRYQSLVDRLVHLVTQNSGMIVLPGGIGTLTELAMAWNLIQVEEISARPLISIGTMWQQFFELFASTKYVSESHVDLFQHAEQPMDAILILKQYSSRYTN